MHRETHPPRTALRGALMLGVLVLLDVALLVATLAILAATWTGAQAVGASPDTAVIGLLAGGGLLGLFLAGLELTRAGYEARRDCTGRSGPRNSTAWPGRARWATRLAAVLIGAGGSAAHAAPGPSPAVVIGAPANPGAGHTGASPTLPTTAPDPRWVSAEPGPGRSDISLVVRPTRFGTEDEIVVRRGECLWDIVARALGPRAGAAEIAAEWPRWYAANRVRIGDEPDLIHPGLRLVIPKERS